MYSKKMDLAEFAFGASSPKFDESLYYNNLLTQLSTVYV